MVSELLHFYWCNCSSPFKDCSISSLAHYWRSVLVILLGWFWVFPPELVQESLACITGSCSRTVMIVVQLQDCYHMANDEVEMTELV